MVIIYFVFYRKKKVRIFYLIPSSPDAKCRKHSRMFSTRNTCALHIYTCT